jgi:glycosyltransferase involved in cell wall biosynthesis
MSITVYVRRNIMKKYAGKILIIVQNLPIPFIRRVWLEAQTLRDNGYKVSVICPKSQEYPKSYEVIDEIAIYRYKIPFLSEGVLSYFFEFTYSFLVTAFLSLKVLLREGFDVIQSCNPPDTCFLFASFYRMFGKQFVFDHHDLSPEMFLAKYNRKDGFLYRGLLFLERLTMQTARVVISTNESYRTIAITRGRKQPEDVFALRTGPDFTNLKIQPREDELKCGRQYLICYLGEMCPQDGIDYLLHSADYLVNHLRRKDVLFVLMGGGPSMKKFKMMSEEMGLSDYVKFTGRIPDFDVCRYLSTADVCVDPDPWSEWADNSTMNKIMEYMTFGKPIVAFDLKEGRVSAQDAAVYVEPNDFKSFAIEINKLLQNPVTRRIMGESGLRRVREKLAWRHTHRPLLEAYDKIFNNNLAQLQEMFDDSIQSVMELHLDAQDFTVPTNGKNGKNGTAHPVMEWEEAVKISEFADVEYLKD